MANIRRFNPISPLEDMFDELTRRFFVRPVSFPGQAGLQIKLDRKEDDKSYKRRSQEKWARRPAYQRELKYLLLPGVKRGATQPVGSLLGLPLKDVRLARRDFAP